MYEAPQVEPLNLGLTLNGKHRPCTRSTTWGDDTEELNPSSLPELAPPDRCHQTPATRYAHQISLFAPSQERSRYPVHDGYDGYIPRQTQKKARRQASSNIAKTTNDAKEYPGGGKGGRTDSSIHGSIFQVESRGLHLRKVQQRHPRVDEQAHFNTRDGKPK